MSARIRRARSISSLTQARLAILTGVNRSAVAQWECGSGTSPNTANLAQVAVATDVCFEWLATGRGPCKSEANELEMPALAVHEFAQNECEAQALELLRRLSPKRQRLACKMLELFAA